MDAVNLSDKVATGGSDCVDLRRHVEVCIQHRPKRTHGVNRYDGHFPKLNGIPFILVQVAWVEDTQLFCFGIIQLEMVSQEPDSHFIKVGNESEVSCIEIFRQGWVVEGVDGGVTCISDTSHHAI